MASFEGSIGTPSGKFNLMVEYSISQSIEGNYSDVSAIGYVKRNDSNYWPYNGYGGDGSLTIDGNTSTARVAYDLRTDGYKQIMSHSKRVEHNSDGTKSITISFNFNGNLSSGYPNGSISQYITLPTIPRASDIGCSSPYIGDSATITISKKSSSLTSTIWYVFGNVTNTIATKTYDTVLSFNTNSVKSQLYAQIPNSQSGYGTMYCDTYSGNTLIGRKSCQFYLYAKESDCRPIFSTIFKDIKPATIEQTGDDNIIVKGASNLQVTINATAKYSSYISSYSVICNDGQKDTNQVSVICRPKDSIFKVSVKDSRGYSTTKEYDLAELNQWLDYIELAYTSDISVKRSEQLSDEVILNVEGNFYNGKLGTTAGLRHVRVGDDLSGKTIYCNFNGSTFTSVIKSNIDELITANKEIKSSVDIDNDEVFIMADDVVLYDAKYVEYPEYADVETYISLNEYTLPDDFGVVTFVYENSKVYKSIFILSDDDPVDNNNTLSMYFQYKISGTLGWYSPVTISPTISGNKFYVNDLVLGNYFDHNQEYVFRIIAQDKLMNAGIGIEQVVTKATPIVRIGEEFVQVNGELLIDESSLVNQYSTSGIKTHKKWIDGKPIYRKVFTGNITDTTNEWVNLQKCNLNNVDNIINLSGTIKNTSSDRRVLSTDAYESTSYHCTFSYLGQTDYLQCFVNGWTYTTFGFKYIVIIEYTKTTD